MTSGLQPFLIANTRVGLQRDMESWLLPNDAYPEVEDCYLWRGRIKKKQGYQLLGRLVRNMLNGLKTGVSVTLAQQTTAGLTTTIIDILNDNNMIVIVGGSSIRTNIATAQIVPGSVKIVVAGSSTFTDDSQGNLIGGAPGSTINYITGAVTLNFAVSPGVANITVTLNYFPNLPVMGLRTLETTTLNKYTLVAFDTRFSYIFNTASALFNDVNFLKTTNNEFYWQGSDSQFFWTTNYYGALWATNFNPGFQNTPTVFQPSRGDGIRWFDENQSGWVNFLPPVDSANFLMGALMLIPYKDSLVALNTWEGTAIGSQINYPQRARWSAPLVNPYAPAGVPVPASVAAAGGTANANTWRSDIPGNGDFLDAPTLEAIVSAEFVKDTLIVFFERSTWQLAWTGNDQLPFQWIKINTELGATSTFSEIPFDKVVLGVGDVGIHACDSVNVLRIDQKIPDETFGIQNQNNGRQRVYGVRDYFNQLVYWSFPFRGPDPSFGVDDDEAEVPPPGIDLIYPNKILVYNYVDKSFAYFNDSFTCFGYYERAADLTWNNVSTRWNETFFPWVSVTQQQQFPFIVAGNQQGFVEVFDANLTFNSDSLYISSITVGPTTTTIVSFNHNLTEGQFVKVTEASGVDGIVGKIYKILSVVDANTFIIFAASTGAFTGSGTLTVVSNFNLVTKRFNPFIEEGAQVRLGIIDFYFETTDYGQVSVNIFIDEGSSIPVSPTGYSPPSSDISAITIATQAVITVADGTLFKAGDDILVTNVSGMVEIDGLYGIVISVAGNNVTTNINSSTFSPYTSGGLLFDLSDTTSNIVNTFPESTYQMSPDALYLNNDKIWKRQNYQVIAQLFCIQITLNDVQMADEQIAGSDIVLHGMIPYFSKAGRLINV